MRSENMPWIRTMVVCAAMALAATSQAAAPKVEAFFGDFEGEAISGDSSTLQKRDLRVKISGIKNGFTVNWISVTKRADGKLKRKEYSIDFHPTRRKGIFRSGQRKDMFGNDVPMDPMEGEPYVWARIHDDTLTVYALHVLEDGGYEMQTYMRRRIPEGLDLRYSRVRDGEILRTLKGTLLEVK